MSDRDQKTASFAPGHGVVPPTQRLDEIDVAKGIGILLVVVGHIVAVRSEGPVGYAVFKTYLYQFHMPFFMYLSGFAFWRACEKYGDVEAVKYTLARANRLLVPFFTFGLLIIVAKAAAKSVVHVDDAPAQLWIGVSSLLVHTNNSPALSIWYVFVLFFYSVFSFSLRLYKRDRIAAAFVLSAVLYVVDVGDFLYANRIFAYYFFFVIGMFISSRYELYKNRIKSNFNLYLIVFTGLSGSLIYLDRTQLVPLVDSNKITVMLASLAAIPFLHSMSMIVTGRTADCLRFFGKNSFAIYLMNTIAIGLLKAVYVSLLFEMNSAFLLYALLATTAGLLIPVMVASVLKRYSPTLSKYIA